MAINSVQHRYLCNNSVSTYVCIAENKISELEEEVDELKIAENKISVLEEVVDELKMQINQTGK